MNKYDAEDEAMTASFEQYFINQTLYFIQCDKNVSPKDIAAALRCDHVPIPKEILHYAAGWLDGSPKQKGKPIDVNLESCKDAFRNEWQSYIENSFPEILRREFAELKTNGMDKDEACENLAAKYELSEIKISRIIYPRRKK